MIDSVNIKPVRVLADTNIFRIAVTGEATTEDKQVKWGDLNLTAEIAGIKQKALKDPKRKEQIEALATICRMARDGSIQMLDYSEIKFEQFRGRRGCVGLPGDLLKGIKFETVPAAIERSFFQQSLIQEHMKGERVEEFCEFLLSLQPERVQLLIDLVPTLPEKLQNNLRNIGRFHEICQDLHRKHYRDVLHFWTAEVNGADYFLTDDGRFCSALRESSRASLTTLPVRPVHLLDEMGIKDRDLLPLDDGKVHSISE